MNPTPNPSRSVSPEPTKGETDDARVIWRTEYDDPEAVLALVRKGADEEHVREALKAFAESVRLEGGLDMQDFEFMIENTAKAFDCVTGGYASKPMTLYTVIEQLVSERIERAVDEAIADTESAYIPLVEAAEAWRDAGKALHDLHEAEALAAIPSDVDWAGRVADAWNAHDRTRDALLAALVQVPGQQKAEQDSGGGVG